MQRLAWKLISVRTNVVYWSVCCHTTQDSVELIWIYQKSGALAVLEVKYSEKILQWYSYCLLRGFWPWDAASLYTGRWMTEWLNERFWEIHFETTVHSSFHASTVSLSFHWRVLCTIKIHCIVLLKHKIIPFTWHFKWFVWFVIQGQSLKKTAAEIPDKPIN